MKIYKDVLDADVVIAFSRTKGIYAIKNRYGGVNDASITLSNILDIAIHYTPSVFEPLINEWIERLKIYKTFE